jgi:hypothetical protein
MPRPLRNRMEHASLLDLAIATSVLATIMLNLILASETVLAAANFVPTYN